MGTKYCTILYHVLFRQQSATRLVSFHWIVKVISINNYGQTFKEVPSNSCFKVSYLQKKKQQQQQSQPDKMLANLLHSRDRLWAQKIKLEGQFLRCHAISINSVYRIFHIDKKRSSMDQFIMPNLGNMPSFTRIRWKLIKNIRIPKIASFYEHMYVKIVCIHHKTLCLTGLVHDF